VTPRIKNRVPRIRENHHWVSRIKENRVPRIREIRSLQVHIKSCYQVPNIFLKKTDLIIEYFPRNYMLMKYLVRENLKLLFRSRQKVFADHWSKRPIHKGKPMVFRFQGLKHHIKIKSTRHGLSQMTIVLISVEKFMIFKLSWFIQMSNITIYLISL